MPAYCIIFDVETNGLHPSRFSVLSFSALNVQTWRTNGHRHFKVQEELDRFYYPQEAYNYYAIKVNGLTRDVIARRREKRGDKYPRHFDQDREVVDFCRQVDLAVCHNTSFDTKFLQQAHNYEFPSTFCTMRSFSQYCSIPHPHHRIKWPKLEEAVQIICGRNDFAFHDSLADCYAVLEILKVMGNSEEFSGECRWSEIFDGVFGG